MPARTHSARGPATGRFGRPAPAPEGRFARAGRAGGRHAAPAASRRTAIVTRRKPQKTGMAKVLDSVGGALPGGAKTSRGRRGGAKGKGKGMGAGLAVLAGAAGLAVKNRGRLQGMLRRKDKDATAHADAPAQPVVEVQPGGGPVGADVPPSVDRPGG
jgi:hypothetical protein